MIKTCKRTIENRLREFYCYKVYKPVCSRMYVRAFIAYSKGLVLFCLNKKPSFAIGIGKYFKYGIKISIPISRYCERAVILLAGKEERFGLTSAHIIAKAKAAIKRK